MANSLYYKAKEAFLLGQLVWSGADVIKVALVTSGYVPNLTTHQYVSALDGYVIARSNNLTNRSSTNGIASADGVTFSSVSPSMGNVQALVVYKDTGSDASSPLIAYIHTATGLPLRPNGSDVIINWDSNKVFNL